MIFKVPLFYYPTTICLVDNDDGFTSSLKKSLIKAADCSPSSIKTFDTTDPFIAFAHQDKRRNHLLQRFISPLDEDVTENYLSNFDIRNLFKALYEENRYEEFSTLIVDYDMPNMTGLELCDKIDNPAIQKILLTGAANESVAIEAFNKGLIHGYIQKHDTSMTEKVVLALKKSFQSYFLGLSRSLESYIDSEDLKKTPLTNKDFAAHFDKMIKKHNIKEYYLLQLMGSYLLVDRDHNKKGMYTYGEDFVETLLDSGESEHAKPSILKALQSFEQMLCYYDPHHSRVPQGDLWQQYLRPTTKITTPGGIFGTTVSELLFKLDTNKLKLRK